MIFASTHREESCGRKLSQGLRVLVKRLSQFTKDRIQLKLFGL